MTYTGCMHRLDVHTDKGEYPHAIEAMRFAASRQERPDDEVAVFEGSEWSDAQDNRQARLKESFQETLRLLGIETISADRIRAARYTPDGGLPIPKSVQFSGEWKVEALFEQVADLEAMLADRPNDYGVEFEIDLGEGLVAVVREDSEEAGLICDACTGIDDQPTPGDSCRHHESEFDIQTTYRVALRQAEPSVAS